MEHSHSCEVFHIFLVPVKNQWEIVELGLNEHQEARSIVVMHTGSLCVKHGQSFIHFLTLGRLLKLSEHFPPADNESTYCIGAL
jgi:hypothetical protein